MLSLILKVVANGANYFLKSSVGLLACSSAPPLTKMNHAIIITTYTQTKHTEAKSIFWSILSIEKVFKIIPISQRTFWWNLEIFGEFWIFSIVLPKL